MRIFVTRHGQPATGEYYNNDNRYPAWDPGLTETGRLQAVRVGEHMKELGFKGDIFVSPYRRTLETAEQIAGVLGMTAKVLPKIHEIFWMEEKEAKLFKGLTAEEINSEFRNIRADADMIYPWWPSYHEDMDGVFDRINTLMDSFLPKLESAGTKEVLFVSHGAPSYATIKYLKIENYRHPKLWNCCVSMRDTETGENYAHDVDFMPFGLITDNGQTISQYEEELRNADGK